MFTQLPQKGTACATLTFSHLLPPISRAGWNQFCCVRTQPDSRTKCLYQLNTVVHYREISNYFLTLCRHSCPLLDCLTFFAKDKPSKRHSYSVNLLQIHLHQISRPRLSSKHRMTRARPIIIHLLEPASHSLYFRSVQTSSTLLKVNTEASVVNVTSLFAAAAAALSVL